MAQPVSIKFANAQDSPANLPVAKVQLVLGNYFSSAAYGTTATASSINSANYPASGAIDGDRTEINQGAPSDADNGVGKSVWASLNDVSTETPTLTLTMAQSRTLNRIKLYHLQAASLTSYSLSYWNGTAFVVFAATSDRAQPGQTSIVTTGKLDIIDFSDVVTTKIRLTVYAAVGNTAYVVEIEGYRILDITQRIKGVKVSRQRDYKLANPMAAQVQLDCINTDRFFSISHVPTAAESAAGFVNTELRPNLPIIISFGFNLYGASPELVPSIVAYLDAITPRPKSRDCRITGRDGMKGLINQTDSSNLKINIELSQAIQYVLNRGNISNYEMNLGVTNITLPYFFTDNEDHLTTVRNLTQAAGDSLFYFNESGIAVFQFYTGNLPLSFTFPIQQDWAAGTFAGNMTQNGSDQLQLNVQFANPLTSNNAGATTPGLITAASPSGFAVQTFAQSFALPYQTILTAIAFTIVYQSGGTAATVTVWADNGGQPGGVLYTASQALVGGFVQTTLAVSKSPNLTLAAGNYWFGIQLNGGSDTLNSGLMNSSTPQQTAPLLNAPYTYTLCLPANRSTWTRILSGSDINHQTTLIQNWGTYTVDQTSGSGTWTSPVRDLSSGLTAYSPIIPTSVPNGNTITYLTQSSADGIHFSGFVPVAANGQPQSPVQRYLQVQVSMVQNPQSGTSALVLDLQINWTGGLGTRKYPAAPSAFTFDYNSNLIDVAQELADNLGGDTSIINDVSVQAAPLLLTGANTDTTWQGTIGTPPVNISGSTPLTVVAGTPITVAPYISGGMDVSRMSGANPAAAAITFAGGATGTWAFTTINPTLPVLVITITHSGTITDLRIVGKTFSSTNVLQAALARSASSIQQFGDRKQSVQNKWIASFQIAQTIANNILSVFGSPFSYIPSFTLQPTFSMQIGDRVTLHDVNLDVNADYITVGIDNEFKISVDKGQVQTTGKLLAVPAGL